MQPSEWRNYAFTRRFDSYTFTKKASVAFWREFRFKFLQTQQLTILIDFIKKSGEFPFLFILYIPADVDCSWCELVFTFALLRWFFALQLQIYNIHNIKKWNSQKVV